MSDDENLWKWDKFVEIGNNIHRMRGHVRIGMGEVGLKLALYVEHVKKTIETFENKT